MSEQLAIALTPIDEIKEFVDVLADMGIDPLHLHIDGHRPTDARPSISVWIRHRTEFEAICARLKAKPVERRYSQPGQREWWAESDTTTRRLLMQCVSFEHHHDWEPRPTQC